MLTKRIADLTEHLKRHKRGRRSRRGLLLLVAPSPPACSTTSTRRTSRAGRHRGHRVDYRWLSLGTRHPRAVITAARLAAAGSAARLRRRRLLTMGQALAAGLRAGLPHAGVPVLARHRR